MAPGKPRRRRPRKGEPDIDRPPLGPDAEPPQPLEGQTPAMAREYDPGFKAPAEDDDPWQDEGRPEASG